jgi:hypothetical protein
MHAPPRPGWPTVAILLPGACVKPPPARRWPPAARQHARATARL